MDHLTCEARECLALDLDNLLQLGQELVDMHHAFHDYHPVRQAILLTQAYAGSGECIMAIRQDPGAFNWERIYRLIQEFLPLILQILAANEEARRGR